MRLPKKIPWPGRSTWLRVVLPTVILVILGIASGMLWAHFKRPRGAPGPHPDAGPGATSARE